MNLASFAIHDDTWVKVLPGERLSGRGRSPQRRTAASARRRPARTRHPNPPRILVTHPDPFERLARARSTMRARSHSWRERLVSHGRPSARGETALEVREADFLDPIAPTGHVPALRETKLSRSRPVRFHAAE